MKQQKPKITIDFSGPEGNIFFIIGKACKVISREDSYKLRNEIINCHSYEEAISKVKEYVTIVSL